MNQILAGSIQDLKSVVGEDHPTTLTDSCGFKTAVLTFHVSQNMV